MVASFRGTGDGRRRTAGHERERPAGRKSHATPRSVPLRATRSGDRTHRATDGHLGSAARHCELAARLAAHLRRHPRQLHTSLSSRRSHLTSLRRKWPSSSGDARGPPLVSHLWSSFPALAEKGSLQSRIATSRLPAHIPDLAALEGGRRDGSWIAAVNAGYRATLIVPLLKDNEIVGTITLGRKQVQPFTDKQISLFRTLPAQATIALESTRLERQYREAQMALAHANRVATMGQLTASITHEVN